MAPVHRTNSFDTTRHFNSRRSFVASEAENIRRDLERLPSSTVEISSSPKRFVPKREIQAFLTRRKIEILLENRQVHGVEVEVIHKYYRNVFAILTKIGRYEFIIYFTPDEGYQDEHLPFRTSEYFPIEARDIYDEFCEAQWEFCAQVFYHDQLDHKRFLPKRIIPITRRRVIKTSFDALIEEVELDPEYNKLVPKNNKGVPCTNTFVLKSYVTNIEVYENEVSAYKMLRHNDLSRNLVKFFGSWIQNDRYYILLEYVDGGTLSELFSQCSHPNSSQELRTFWTNLVQVLNPLSRIHVHVDPQDDNTYIEGIHQDLKPENILTTRDNVMSSRFERDFKLVDLGLTYFDKSTSDKGKGRLRDGRGSQTYGAPETFREESDQFLGRSVRPAQSSKDVWSIGCTFSEALVWSVLGTEGLKDYQSQRITATEGVPALKGTLYNGCFHNGQSVLEIVQRMHGRVKTASTDHFVKDLVDIVDAMLQDVEQRPDIFNIRRRCLKALSHTRKADSPSETIFPRVFRTSSIIAACPPPTVPTLSLTTIDANDQVQGFGREVNLSSDATPKPPQHQDRQQRPSPGSRVSSTTSVLDQNQSIDAVINESPTRIQESTSVSSTFHAAALDVTAQGRVAGRMGWSSSGYLATGHEIPFVNIEDVLRWIARKKEHVLLAGPSPVPDVALDFLSNRDHVFLVDNSRSMHQHSSGMKKVFEALAYLVKNYDPDGIELYSSRDFQHERHRDRRRLLSLYDKFKFDGDASIGIALQKILKHHINAHRSPSVFHRKSRKTFGLTIYILTDGLWARNDGLYRGIFDLIRNTVKEINGLGELGFQFIQFGDDPGATSRLNQLDNDWKKHRIPKDIVDTEPSSGNVFKMLRGSVDSRWDNAPPSTSSSSTPQTNGSDVS